MAEQACRCGVHRRAFLGMAAALATLPGAALGQGKPKYEAMMLGCIDPRIVDPMFRYMHGRGLDGRYSQFVFAGAAIGVEAPSFEDWRKTFWENLATSIELHRVSRLVVIDHRDCGAARIAYGAESIATPQAETQTHRRVLIALKAEMARRYPALQFEGLLMALDGKVEALA